MAKIVESTPPDKKIPTLVSDIRFFFTVSVNSFSKVLLSYFLYCLLISILKYFSLLNSNERKLKFKIELGKTFLTFFINDVSFGVNPN